MAGCLVLPRMTGFLRPRIAAVLCGLVVVAGLTPVATARTALASPPVVAIIGEAPGINVLHDDFRTADGRDPVYPSSMPKPQFVSLPTSGTFAERLAVLEAGPL